MTDRYPFVFSPWQERQGIATIVRNLFRYPIQHERWKARGRTLLAALREYAEFNGISTDRDGWYEQAVNILSRDMFSLVLPMLPPIKFDGMDLDQASLDQWAHALRRLVNREATEELLGTSQEMDPPRPSRVTKAEEIILLALEVEFARRSDRLNQEDDRAIEAMRAADSDEREAARALGWTEVRLRKRMQRIRQKLA